MSEVMNVLAGIQIEEWRPDGAGAVSVGAASLDAASVGAASLGAASLDPASLDSASLDRDIDMLSEVLHAVVHDGAGVSFVVPFSQNEARAFWIEKVLPGVRTRTRRVLVARSEAGIVGTVQLELAWPPNQQHRAEVTKLLVHPVARRRGVARVLMIALEDIARSEGRTLLTLDTWTGGAAEQLYRSLGYVTVGVIPRYARGSLTPELEPTTIMYKELVPPAPAERHA